MGKIALLGASALRPVAFLGLVAGAVSPATAQDTPAAGGDESIVVTGSRIPRPDITSIIPVAVVDSLDLERDAATNIQDTLAELPQFGVGNGRTNSNFLTSGNGVATLNLRNLGINRTLTLVNGRRFIGGFAGSSAVDVNSIPTDFVDRVEVVTGGASSIYGSDAVAGVVNFILKQKLEGISVRGQYDITEMGDNPRYFGSLSGGTSFGADDRGSFMANLSYANDGGLKSRKRFISSQDCGTPFGAAAGIICGPDSYSVFSPQGQFIFNRRNSTGNEVLGGIADTFTFDRTNSVVLGYPTGSGYNRNNDRYISVPVERYIASAIARWEFSDSLELFAEGTYTKVKSRSSLEPSAIGIGATIPAFTVPDTIRIDNPFIPASIAATIAARNSDSNPANDITSISTRRRFNEVFDRSNKNDRDVYRIAAGLRGDLGDDWKYELSYVFGQFKDHTESETADVRRIANALDAERLPDGTIRCRSAAARAEGCAPLNLFGFGTASPEASAYVQAVVPKTLDIDNKQQVVSASIAGSPFAIWAGNVGIALGAEYRKEETFSDNDILTNLGQNIGNITQDLRGEFDVKEAFGEINVPLLRDTFIDYLGVNFAGRYSDYSTIGRVFSWNAGAELVPFEGLRLRGVYAKANRAPNVGELFTQANETFTAVTDPCNGVTATNDPGGYGAVCRAIPAIAAAVASTGTFSYSLAQLQSINGFVGGNTALNEETAKTITLGAVFTPTFLPGASLTVDYFDIKVDGAIATLGRNFSIQQCLKTGNPVFCDNVIRRADGRLETVNGQLINVATIATNGIDVGARYRRALGLADDDRIDFSLNYSHVFHWKNRGNPAVDPTEFAGSVGVSKDRGTARIGYTTGPVSASWQANYIGKAIAVVDFVNTNPDILAMNNIPAFLYHDVQLRWDIGDERKFSFYAGINNVFDKQPPFLPSPPFASPTGTETQGDVYDPYGRRFYVGTRVAF